MPTPNPSLARHNTLIIQGLDANPVYLPLYVAAGNRGNFIQLGKRPPSHHLSSSSRAVPGQTTPVGSSAYASGLFKLKPAKSAEELHRR